MAIDFSGVSSSQSGGRNRVNEQQNSTTRNSGAGDAQPSVNQQSTDTVKISDAAQAVKSASAQLQAQPDVDTGRVAELKRAIEDGSYSVNSDRVADRMLKFDQLFS